jgi:hypothetical protein
MTDRIRVREALHKYVEAYPDAPRGSAPCAFCFLLAALEHGIDAALRLPPLEPGGETGRNWTIIFRSGPLTDESVLCREHWVWARKLPWGKMGRAMLRKLRRRLGH